MKSGDSNPFDEIRQTIRTLALVGAIFMGILALLSISGVSIAWYAVSQNVKENRERIGENTQLVLSMCRQNNEQNLDIIITALDLGVPPSKLTAFNPIACTIENIERRYGHE